VTTGHSVYVSYQAGGTVTLGDSPPDWRDRIAKGQNATSTMDGVFTHIKCPIGISSWSDAPNDYGFNVGNLTGTVLWVNDPGSGIDSVADSKARSKLLKSYIDAQNTWRGGNFLAEVRETYHMLKHPIESFYHQTYQFAGKIKRLGRVYTRDSGRHNLYAKQIADAWLAFAFGVTPTINDLNDAIMATDELLNKSLRHDSTPIKGFGRNTVISLHDIVGIGADTWAGDSSKSERLGKTTLTVRYKGAVLAKPQVQEAILDKFGVGIFDVVPAVWEAIPWSFFIDYFTNVGEFLDAFRYADAYPSWLQRTVRNSGLAWVGPPSVKSEYAWLTKTVNCGPARCLRVRVSRVPLVSMPYPSWRFQIPGTGSMKWLNIAALTEQCFGSKPPVTKLK